MLLFSFAKHCEPSPRCASMPSSEICSCSLQEVKSCMVFAPAQPADTPQFITNPTDVLHVAAGEDGMGARIRKSLGGVYHRKHVSNFLQL